MVVIFTLRSEWTYAYIVKMNRDVAVNVSGGLSELPYDYLNSSDFPNCTDCNDSYYGNYYNDGMMNDIMFYIILWQYVTPALFGLILIVGISGNALVLYVILSQQAMRTVTNILLLNLAVSDISFLVITVPFTAYKYVASSWDFGDTFCKVVKFFLYVSAYVTVWTLVAISGYRYLTVVRSNSSARYRTRSNVIICCLCIWGASVGSQIPVLLAHTLKTVAGYTYCGIINSVLEAVFVSFFVCAYIMPLLLICILYVPIMLHLRQNKASTIDNAHAKERTARACKVIILVVVVFCISWLPLHIQNMVAYYGTLPSGAYYEVFRVIWNCMPYGNSCANPFIYNYASQEFRKAFRQVLCCGNMCQKSRHKEDAQHSSELTRMVAVK